jgi:predicted Zn-dependent protease
MLKKFVLLFAVAMVMTSCATVPVTGRQGIHLVPDSEMTQLSLASYQKLIEESTLSQNTSEVNRLRNVGRRLAQATEAYLSELGVAHQPYQWEYNLIESDQANAFCMPGGKIGVYTGILPIAQNDAGLAVVMGHEIAHAIAKHGNERMSQNMIVEMGGQALSVALRNQPGLTQSIFKQSYGLAGQTGVLLPYSRLHETEADRIGMIIMARAGYDPRETVVFWERMSSGDSSRPPGFLSTHPSPWKRIEQINSYMPEALSHYSSR